MIRNGKRLGFLPGWRIFTYVIVATHLLMLSWLIASVASADWHSGCGPLETLTCTGGTNAGPGIAALLVITVWALVTLILGSLWLSTGYDRARPCLECGHEVAFGTFECARCTFTFRRGIRERSAYFDNRVPHS